MLALYLAACHSPEAASTISKCSWRWTQKASETCIAVKNKHNAQLYHVGSFIYIYIYIYIYICTVDMSPPNSSCLCITYCIFVVYLVGVVIVMKMKCQWRMNEYKEGTQQNQNCQWQQKNSEKNLSKCHFMHSQYRKNYSEIENEPTRSETCYRPTELT